MTIARHVRVTGRVQGVFFRAWTRDQAKSLGVVGWVRNCADGSLQAHVEGKDHAVQQLIERMRKGPPNALVEDLWVETSEPENLSAFEVRR